MPIVRAEPTPCKIEHLQAAVFIMTGVVDSLDVQEPERVCGIYWCQVAHESVLFGAKIGVVVSGGSFHLGQRGTGDYKGYNNVNR